MYKLTTYIVIYLFDSYTGLHDYHNFLDISLQGFDCVNKIFRSFENRAETVGYSRIKSMCFPDIPGYTPVRLGPLASTRISVLWLTQS